MSITFDKGGNFIQTTTLPIGQFYEVTYDYATPYNICGGAQDNGTWCGPSKRKGPVNNSYWFTYAGGDGFYSAQDPSDPNIIYGESQGGNASRVNLKTGERMSFRKPSWQERYKQWEDSIAIVRGDPLKPETKEQTKALAALRAQQKQDSIDLALRFNWNTPLVSALAKARGMLSLVLDPGCTGISKRIGRDGYGCVSAANAFAASSAAATQSVPCPMLNPTTS